MTSTDLAVFLLDPASEPLIRVFLGREATVQDAATQTGGSLNTTYKRVQRLLALGFLTPGGGTERAGRQVKTYRSGADIYYVPYAVTPHDTLEAQQIALERPRSDLFASLVVRARLRLTPGYGRSVFRNADGLVDSYPAVAPGELLRTDHPQAAPYFNLCESEIWLDTDDAHRFQLELEELHARYRQRGGSRPFLLRLGLVSKS